MIDDAYLSPGATTSVLCKFTVAHDLKRETKEENYFFDKFNKQIQ
jgi:hypothetical protein